MCFSEPLLCVDPTFITAILLFVSYYFTVAKIPLTGYIMDERLIQDYHYFTKYFISKAIPLMVLI